MQKSDIDALIQELEEFYYMIGIVLYQFKKKKSRTVDRKEVMEIMIKSYIKDHINS
jgi:uncharacterized protein (UPF0297 family)